MADTTTKDNELFESINSIVQGEHAHYINRLKPLIMPLITQYGDQREREGRIDEVRKAIGIWDVGISAPQQLLNRLSELKNEETKQ